METGSMVLCILGAIVGAGFASGRELMQFFSRYGGFSWVLVGVTALAMTTLIFRVMRSSRSGMSGIFSGGRGGKIGQAALSLLLLCTGGGMTAAAGELLALTLPIPYARGLGLAGTLTASLILSRKPLGILEHLGRLLLPLVTVAFLLCLRLPEREMNVSSPSASQGAVGLLQALGYAGMNVALATGILCDAGARCALRGMCRGAAWAGGAIGALLALGNAALLPFAAELGEAPLPVVVLLSAYGQAGYYLGAGALYLAVATTLIAVLRALCLLMNRRLGRHLFPLVWLGVGAVALTGFERIVAYAYPALGILSFLLLSFPQKRKGTAKRALPSGKGNQSSLNIS